MKAFRVCLLAAAASVLAGSSIAQPAAPKTCTPIPEEKIGYQLYNLLSVLREGQPAPGRGQPQTTSAAVLDKNFAAMRAAGFRSVERFGDTLGIPVADYAALARKNGQTVIGNHGGLDPVSWDKAMDDATLLGQKEIGSSGFGQPGLDTLEHTLATAANLNALGQRAAARGLRLYVHNHTLEITTKFPYDLNKTGSTAPVSAWEIIAANTDPRYVHFEIDVHWARVAFGLDHFDQLVAFLQKYQNRIDALHIKDTLPDTKMADLGLGVTDWPAVYRAAGPGVRYYIWEFDNVPDVFKSANIAHRFLRCEK